ncbi:Crp/Fnr family transcriptional regulator [Bradyrhizobium sp. ORS 375]|uniref:Crp/Fnr family transcriptional regulator n=1 Tax=Bradyrhizobium sp. (strain ORS 375) TaxID=566679 RepID=UPI0005541F52|nr:Crp/Fnr family transcriptional regulator [Bradyrhizobium sp. ORS 375]
MKNALLSKLPPAELAKLAPLLKYQSVQQHTVLFHPDQPMKVVYFPISAVISLVAELATGETIEAAMVGSDGAVGATSALSGAGALSRGVVKLAGDVLVCDVADLRTVAMNSAQVMSLLIRHDQSVYAQAQQSVACSATHSVQARLCRWLLRARDFSGDRNLQFTHEYLAVMLGVTRSSVTTEARLMQEAGLIRYARGSITILDLEALEECACECYTAVKLQYSRLLSS